MVGAASQVKLILTKATVMGLFRVGMLKQRGHVNMKVMEKPPWHDGKRRQRISFQNLPARLRIKLKNQQSRQSRSQAVAENNSLGHVNILCSLLSVLTSRTVHGWRIRRSLTTRLHHTIRRHVRSSYSNSFCPLRHFSH